MMDKIENFIKNKNVFRVWFRIDDIGLYNKKTFDCLNLFIKYNIPAYLAVIPKKLNKNVAEFINNCPQFHIMQHGFDHINRSEEGKNEFPKVLKSDIANNNILKGYNILKKWFGNQFDSIFCPPWYEFDELHLDLLKPKFDCISSCEDVEYEGFKQFNVNVDTINWSINDKFAGEKYFYQQLVNASDNFNIYGIVLHHRTMGKKGFVFLDKLLYFLSKQDNIEFVIYS